MESQKIKNLIDHKDEIYSRYQTKKWYVINDQNNGNYTDGNTNDKSIKIDTEVVKRKQEEMQIQKLLLKVVIHLLIVKFI